MMWIVTERSESETMPRITLKATPCKHGVSTLVKGGACTGCVDYDTCSTPTSMAELLGRHDQTV